MGAQLKDNGMDTTKPAASRPGVSDHQLDLIQQFEADYNAIDHFLRKALNVDKIVSFTHLVNEYSRRHGGWRDADLLRRLAEVRNAIVHEKLEPYSYLAVPTLSTVKEIQACRERLTKPALVIPTFQRKVEVLSIQDSLGQALRIIAKRDYSQFPVYEDRRFKGLLTENGITRWIANHVVDKDLSLIDVDEVPVKEVLSQENEERNFRFVPRDMRVDDIRGLFSTQPVLEAVLVTASSKDSEALLGIATRWNIMQLG